MKSKIIYILCEGQTEQGFVEEVLKPYLIATGITSVKSILINTNKKKNTAGGMCSFSQVQNHLEILFKSYIDNDYERFVFTTIIDYYALPGSFPDYQNSLSIKDKYERIEFLEDSFSSHIPESRFIPYIQLHEFEALVFCGLNYLQNKYPGCESKLKGLAQVLNEVGNPELINNNPNTAPSKRIINAIEKGGKKSYHYNKPMTGKYVTEKVGIENLRKECKHFNEWIENLLNA